MRKVIGYNEILKLLKEGNEIIYLQGGMNIPTRIYIKTDEGEYTVRIDTLSKLKEQELIRSYGLGSYMRSLIKLRGGENEQSNRL